MKDDAITLLVRSFDDELDVNERGRLDDLLDTSAEMRAERERLVRLRAMVAACRVDAFEAGFADRVLHRIDRDAAKHDVSGWRASPRKAVPRTASSRRSISVEMNRIVRSRPGALAAAALVVLAVGAIFWMRPRTVHVPNGRLQTLELSDGSVVELSGGSTLAYRRFFGRAERRVELTGEAFFDVTSGDRPFLVETFNADVRVLGTRFNVRAWPDDARTDVALEEGRVAVHPRADEVSAHTLSAQEFTGPVVLEPGEATTVSADSAAVPRSISLERVVAWRTGGLFIVDQPLGTAFRTIERRFGVHVTAADPALLDSLVSYLNPSPESAADVLATICHTLDLRYRRTADGFEVLAQ